MTDPAREAAKRMVDTMDANPWWAKDGAIGSALDALRSALAAPPSVGARLLSAEDVREADVNAPNIEARRFAHSDQHYANMADALNAKLAPLPGTPRALTDEEVEQIAVIVPKSSVLGRLTHTVIRAIVQQADAVRGAK